jgi:hypothetical protein
MTLSTISTENAAKAVPPVPRPAGPAHIINTDVEAIAIAKALAVEFIKESAARDRDRIWPVKELDAFSQSGLWSINVPKAYGGPEVSYATLAKVIEIISAADSSIGQIAQNHLGVVAAIRTVSDEAQKALPATMSSSTARSSTRPARCSPIWCRSWRSMTRAGPGMPSPSVMRPA